MKNNSSILDAWTTQHSHAPLASIQYLIHIAEYMHYAHETRMLLGLLMYVVRGNIDTVK